MKILLAVDGSEFSDRAVNAVAEGAWGTSSAVKIITAIEPIYMPSDGVGTSPVYYEEVETNQREQAERII